MTPQLDFNKHPVPVDVAKQLRQKVGINGDQPGEIQDGKVKLYVIGQGALGAAATAATKHDIAQAEQWNLPIVLIVLLAVFGSLAAAAMPLVLGICTVAVTMGVVYLLSMYTTMSVFVTSTVSMFGIALAIDYSLFILMRFREELRAGAPQAGRRRRDGHIRPRRRAVRFDRHRVGDRYLPDQHPCAGVDRRPVRSSRWPSPSSPRRTLTPAVLATFGRAAAKRSWLLHWSRRPETTQSRFWTSWTGWVMRRPWLSALGATVLLLTLAAPAFSMVLGNSMQDSSTHARDPRRRQRRGDALGPGALGPVRVLVTFPDGNRRIRADERAAPASGATTNVAGAQRRHGAARSVRQRLSQRTRIRGAGGGPEDMGARQTVDWMRAPVAAGGRANAKSMSAVRPR